MQPHSLHSLGEYGQLEGVVLGLFRPYRHDVSSPSEHSGQDIIKRCFRHVWL
ncbi:hypothetical protein [Vibrio sp. V39_P1S14PM300]|uniref:hypothetical protein n=1 Tax=Vibrio sp. V39_P1S14PM300 TaxID=1938690 RepID=UPI00137268EE|nr:hypothetical protein [Vibrio sp. V39_P1S14PM300]NAX20477.1 hypothetical protein [Vibrio sp. V39_P1S14PM300]